MLVSLENESSFDDESDEREDSLCWNIDAKNGTHSGLRAKDKITD